LFRSHFFSNFSSVDQFPSIVVIRSGHLVETTVVAPEVDWVARGAWLGRRAGLRWGDVSATGSTRRARGFEADDPLW
jgi:hypothetical protein